MDRLTSLTAFVRVVDSGGFSAAARRLEMSTTMVSNHVQSLEDRLGARLLQRTTRKVSLTEVGKAYYDRCVQILADIEQADDIAGAQQLTPRGTLRIYSATHIVQFVSPVVAAEMSGVRVTRVSWPGTMSLRRPKSGILKPWMRSSEVSTKTTGWPSLAVTLLG